jgi:peptidyl-prolyl cis-trans isomerase B (cyclophilin B)
VATNKDRQRQLARERHQRRLAREAARQAKTRQTTKWVSVGFVVLALAAVVTLTAINLSKSNAKTNAGAKPSATPSLSVSPSASPSPSPSETVSANGTVQCTYVSNPPAARNVGLPPSKTSIKGNYQATIVTNRGNIVIDLLNSKAPCTVNSFAFLSAKDYYANTSCFRISTTASPYMLQCGDPKNNGSGGPGYEFADENLTGATYPAGTVAMANGGPNTNGSQFFLVFKNSELPPSYPPFGKIVSGLNILENVAKAGFGPPLSDAGGGQPKEKVEIQSIIVKKT